MASPKVIVETSHLLPYLSARYPPGNMTRAWAIMETNPMRPMTVAEPPRASTYRP